MKKIIYLGFFAGVFFLLISDSFFNNFVCAESNRDYTDIGKQLSYTKFEKQDLEEGFLYTSQLKFQTKYLYGKVSNQITKVGLEVNGVLHPTFVRVKNNQFQYYIQDKFTSKEDQIFLIGYSTDNQVISKHQLLVNSSQGEIKIINNPYSYDTGGALLIERRGDISSCRVRINGKFSESDKEKDFRDNPVISYFFRGTLSNMEKSGVWSGKGEDIRVEIIGYDASGQTVLTKEVNIIGKNEWNPTLENKQLPKTVPPVLKENAIIEKCLELDENDNIIMNSTNFPDNNFRQILLDMFSVDGQTISKEIVQQVNSLDVSQKEIASLKGIELFTELVELNCQENYLTELDLSKNLKLEKVYCDNNYLQQLIISNNYNLSILWCFSNYLTSIDVSNNKSLKSLYCFDNLLKNINLNQELKELLCHTNQIENLDISKNINLETLWCFDNQLEELSLLNNKSLLELYCNSNNLKNIDISNNNRLERMTAYYNQFSQLNVENNKYLTEIAVSPQIIFDKVEKIDETSWKVKVNSIVNKDYVQLLSDNWTYDHRTGTCLYKGVMRPEQLIIKYKIREASPNLNQADFHMIAWINLLEDDSDRPTIFAENKTIQVGSTFTPLANIKAYDKNDGYLKLTQENVVVNSVNTNKAGTYKVVYQVTSSRGIASEKTIQITVIDEKTNSSKGNVIPKSYQIGLDNYLRGTYSGAIDSLKLEVNNHLYVKSTVKGSPFKYYAADKIKNGSDNVYLIAYDKLGNELDRKKVKIDSPTIGSNVYVVGGTDNYVHGSFSGTGSEKIDHVRLEVNDVLYARSTKFDNGKFDYYAVDKIKSTTDKVYVVAYDKDGNQLARTQVALKNGTTQGTITPNKFLLGGTDNYVRGTYTGDVDSIKLEVNGKTLVKSTVKSSPFQYYAVDKITNVKDSVYIIAYDVNGRQLDRQKVTVEEAVKTQITKVDTYTLGASNYVTGTYEGTAKKVGITVNGTSYSPVNINAAGQLSYWSKNIITSSSDDVKVAIYDANGSKIDEKPVTVIQQAGKITKVDPFKVGFDSRITGTFSGAVARVELNVNGVPQSRVPVSNGAFSYYAKNLVTSADDVVKLVAYDSSNNKLDEKEVPIIAASGTLSVDSTTYSLKNSDGRIYGTVTGNISKVKIKIGTTEYSAVNVTNGTFGYYVKNLPLKVGDTITVIGMDNNLTELDTQMVTVID